VLLDEAVDAAVAQGHLRVGERPRCRLEAPEDPTFGDATTRVAMRIARRVGRPALEVAGIIAGHVTDRHGWLDGVEAGGPGFVNVRVSLALWRRALGTALQVDCAARGAGRAIVLDAVPAGREASPRVVLVADTVGRLLAAAGYAVERRTGSIETLGASEAPAEVARAVVVGESDPAPAARRAKALFAAAGGRPGRVAALAVAPLDVRRRGRAVPADDAGRALDHPAVRFCVAATSSARPALVAADRLEAGGIDDPLVSIRYALTRIARLPLAPDPSALDALGEADRECLRLVGTFPDVVDAAARRLEAEAVAVHAAALAAAFHRSYNRGRFAGADLRTLRARRALADGVARVLEAALAILLGSSRAGE
jgi:arginyl-tRNA synthetase